MAKPNLSPLPEPDAFLAHADSLRRLGNDSRAKRMVTYDQMVELKGPSMAFEMTRKEGDDPNVTFSQEALDGLSTSMLLWVGSRITRYWQDTGKATKRLKVLVTVTAEDPA